MDFLLRTAFAASFAIVIALGNALEIMAPGDVASPRTVLGGADAGLNWDGTASRSRSGRQLRPPSRKPPFLQAFDAGVIPGSRARAVTANGRRYIVRLREGPSASARQSRTAMIASPGVAATHVYDHVFTGFAARLTDDAKRKLERDPKVRSVERDRRVFPVGSERSRKTRNQRVERRDRFESRSTREISPQTDGQHVPVGISRIGADQNSIADIDGADERVAVDVAVIDTGIDFSHPDLNVAGYADCTGETDEFGDPFGWDLEGHGTHVAGTVGALDNELGVVGVAPGARLWPIRSFDSFGDGWGSYIICAMDLVADQSATIDVVNMSLGGADIQTTCGQGALTPSRAFHDAFCAMVAAGVTSVVAAGNDSTDASGFSPASFDEAITVSALADSDGQPGALGGSFTASVCESQEVDDSLASFSNYGIDVDIAAPGVGVWSTFPTYADAGSGYLYCSLALGYGYEIWPGTSMAAPHVAGAAALLLAETPDLTPAEVKTALIARREAGSFANDPDGIAEGVLNVADATPVTPTVTPTATPGAPTATPTVTPVTATATTAPPPPPPPPSPSPTPEATPSPAPSPTVAPLPTPGDTNEPNVDIVSPAAGSRVRRNLVVSVRAEDEGSGVALVELRGCVKGDCQVLGQDVTAPWEFTVRLPKGKHSLVAVAVDSARNRAESTPVEVSVASKKKKKGR